MVLRDEIDRSFGAGPALPPVADRVLAGRRALRRRRAATALAGVGIVAVLGTTYALLDPAGPADRGAGEVAVDPTPTPTPTPTPSPSAEDEPWDEDVPLRYRDGRLEVRPGSVVHEHIVDPFGRSSESDALDLTVPGGRRLWTILEADPAGDTYYSSLPSDGWASFADWVADQAGTGAADGGWPATLQLASDGSVVASPGSTVLQRTDDPGLGPAFAGRGVPTGAAVVRAAEDGVGYFVVWRVVGGELDVVTTPPRDVVGASFEQLLRMARARYASGEGLR